MKFNVETIATLGQQATGSVLLAAGSITTPVEVFDPTLPVNFSAFQLRLYEFFIDNRDILSAAFSYDGGTTFIADADNFDTYNIAYSGVNGDGTSNIFNVADSLCYSAFQGSNNSISPPATHSPAAVVFEIFPGSDISLTTAMNINCGSANNLAVNYWTVVTVANRLNPDATVVPIPARATTIRVQPYGNGDANPPTSGSVFQHGTYFLWGVPTP